MHSPPPPSRWAVHLGPSGVLNLSLPNPPHLSYPNLHPLWAVHLGPSAAGPLPLSPRPYLPPPLSPSFPRSKEKRGEKKKKHPAYPNRCWPFRFVPVFPLPSLFLWQEHAPLIRLCPSITTLPHDKKKKPSPLRPWGQREWYPHLYDSRVNGLTRCWGCPGPRTDPKWSRHGLSSWLHSGPSHGSLLVLASRLSTRMLPCWSTLDSYNNAEHIQLASFSSTLLRLTCENKTYVGSSTILHWPFPSHSIRSGTMASYIPHLWPFICPVFADGGRITGHCSRFSYSLSSSTSEPGGLLSSPQRVPRCGLLCSSAFSLCSFPNISPPVSPFRYGMVGTVAGDGAPRSLSVARSSGVCWTRPFSFSDSSLAGLRPFSLPMFHPAHALGVLFVALCCLLRYWLGFYLNWQLMATVSLSLTFRQHHLVHNNICSMPLFTKFNRLSILVANHQLFIVRF